MASGFENRKILSDEWVLAGEEFCGSIFCEMARSLFGEKITCNGVSIYRGFVVLLSLIMDHWSGKYSMNEN